MSMEMPKEDLTEIMRENLELSKKIYKLTKKTNRYLFWSQVAGVLKILIIAIPLVLAIIYLPPLLNNLIGQYRGLLMGGGMMGSGGSLLNDVLNKNSASAENLDLNSLPPEIRKLLGK